MADRSLARRYARAIIEIAEETGATDSIGSELNGILTGFQANGSQLLNALANPVFTADERSRVLEDVLPRFAASPTVSNLLRLMLRNSRIALVPLVVDEFRTYADDHAGRTRVTVETAEPLSAQLEAEVRAAFEQITGKTVELETRVNKDLIGGLVARIGGKVYDASVKARLESLRQALLSQEAAEA